MRPVGDINHLRERIFQRAKDSVAAIPPIRQGDYSLSIEDVDYMDDPSAGSKDILDGLLYRDTLLRRLKGTVVFRGPGVELKKRTVLMGVPVLTDHGTFIIDGVEYSLANQQRLQPGIYVRHNAAGMPEAYANLAAGKTHRYIFDPKDQIFYIRIGQRKLPLYPILRQLGINDEQLRQAWSPTILAANQTKYSQNTAAEFAKQLGAESSEHLRRHLIGMSVNPLVMERNLGVAVDHITPEIILATTSKMLRLYRGETAEDDRDALVNQAIWLPDDLISESILRSRGALRSLLWRLMKNPAKERIGSNILNSAITNLFYQARLAEAATGTNPLSRLDSIYHLTRMGEGGIGSISAIPDSARAIHPTHFGYIDPTTTPESLKVGVDTRIAVNTRIGPEGQPQSQFLDVRTGKKVWLSPAEIYNKVAAFPGELGSGSKFVRAIYRGRETIVPPEQVDYVLAGTADMFGPMSNLIPMKSATFPQRIAMGSRMLTQAVPLLDREAPLVRSINEDGKPFISIFNDICGAYKSPIDGTVSKITDDEIIIEGDNKQSVSIPLFKHRPISSFTGLTTQPIVSVGQKVGKGQVLTTSNYTDAKGDIAIGRNALVAYMPTGETYEDAFVISESFAKKLISEHLLKYDLDVDQATITGKKKYISLFPGKYTKDVLELYDDDGVIKPGAVVTKDMPLVLAATTLPLSTASGSRRRLTVDASITWPYDHPGTVVKSSARPDGVSVLVQSFWPAQQGDKISGLYGNKGVVIVKPDSQMPRLQDGRVVDVIASPYGLISRGNVGQIYEALLGKVADKTGKPIDIKDFENAEKLYDFVSSKLREANLSAVDELYDPVTGKNVKALTGKAYILKLEHMAEEKLQGVGIAQAHTSEDIPVGGEEGKAKRLGNLELNALLAHGAYATITDASLIRGQMDEDLWRMYMSGHALPTPKVPHVWEKFVNMLKAAGINVAQSPRSVRIFALSDKDVKQLVGDRYINNSDTVNIKNDAFVPVGGGLFDEKITGGLSGTKWAGIKLPEPMPNPVMLEPISRILETTPGQIEKLLIVGDDELVNKWGVSAKGPAALAEALSKINIDKEIKDTEARLKTASGSKADMLIRKLSYLKSAKKFGQHPKDWLWTTVPVIPPLFRPMSVLQDGTVISNDANVLYKEVFNSANVLADVKDELDNPAVERMALWRALKSLVGIESPQTYQLQRQKVRGILSTIAGVSPKFGMMQRKLLGASTVISGRGVIVPNPMLDIDQIGIPENAAWEVYKPFVVRELVRRGLSMRDALEKVKNRDETARQTLIKVAESRPLLATRAPVWHKYGIMAFKPVITKGRAIEVCPLVTAAFGADFDGDTMQFHVPVSDAAVKEAFDRLLPSRNLFGATTLTEPVFKPSQEFLFGLWKISSGPDFSKPIRVFKNKDDALAAFRRGDISVDQPIKLVET